MTSINNKTHNKVVVGGGTSGGPITSIRRPHVMGWGEDEEDQWDYDTGDKVMKSAHTHTHTTDRYGMGAT